MTLQALIEKVKGGQSLSEEEQKEFFVLLNDEFSQMKEKQPEKYLAYITELTSIVRDLNADLTKAQADLKG